jgi:hypothetical protein
MESIEQDFASLGTVTSVKVLEAPPGANVKAALVRFSSTEEAAYAKDSLNGAQPDGFPEPLVVRFANNSCGRRRWLSRWWERWRERWWLAAIYAAGWRRQRRLQILCSRIMQEWRSMPFLS